MSFQLDDFDHRDNREFKNYSEKDQDLIVDISADVLRKLSKKYGDPFKYIQEEIADCGASIAKFITNLIVKYDGRDVNFETLIEDAAECCVLHFGIKLMEKDKDLGDDRTFDDIKDDLAENPIFQQEEKDGRRGSRRESGRRDSGRRESGRRESGRRDNGRRDSWRRDSGRRDSGRRGGGSSSRRNSGNESRNGIQDDRGVLRQQVNPDVQEQPRESRERNSYREAPQEKVVNNGLVTSESEFEAIIAPVYLMGEEETHLENGQFVIKEQCVDYEKHRVDRFFPDVMGMANPSNRSNLQTQLALKAVEDARALTIKKFMEKPRTTQSDEAEQQVEDARAFEPVLVANPDVFKTFNGKGRSFCFQDVTSITTTTALNFIEIRNEILEDHGGDVTWLRENAMVVDVDHLIQVSAYNDVKNILTGIINPLNLYAMADGVLRLANYIDAAIWKLIHDYVTQQLNRILITDADLGFIVGSITGDWNDLRDQLKEIPESKQQLLQTNLKQAFREVDLHEFVQDDASYVYGLKIRNRFNYIPLTSYECELATASRESNIAEITDDSQVSRFLKGACDRPNAHNHFITLDGMSFEVGEAITLFGIKYLAYLK